MVILLFFSLYFEFTFSLLITPFTFFFFFFKSILILFFYKNYYYFLIIKFLLYFLYNKTIIINFHPYPLILDTTTLLLVFKLLTLSPQFGWIIFLNENSHIKHYLQNRTTLLIHSHWFSNLNCFFFSSPILSIPLIFFSPLSLFFLFALLRFALAQWYVYVNILWSFLFWFSNSWTTSYFLETNQIFV